MASDWVGFFFSSLSQYKRANDVKIDTLGTLFPTKGVIKNVGFFYWQKKNSERFRVKDLAFNDFVFFSKRILCIFKKQLQNFQCLS